MLEWRLEAYRRWLTMREPTWARVDYPKIDYQSYYYYSAPKKDALNRSTRSIRKSSRPTRSSAFRCASAMRCFGITREEALVTRRVDAVFDSVSVATTFKEELKKAGR